MNHPILKHLIAIAAMLLVTTIIFSPMLSGKKLVQGDNLKAQSIMSELREVKAATGRTPLWTNRNFSGMPAFQILAEDKTNLTVPVFNALLLFQGVESSFAGLFLCMLCMYFFMLMVGADWRIALGGALAYAAGNYFVDIAEAGHNTKMVALAFMPAIFGAAILTFRGKYVLGGALTALFVALQLYANHFQITYYTFLLLAIMGFVMLIRKALVKEQGGIKRAFLAGLVLAAGLGLGVSANSAKLWTTLEYQKETTRGNSGLKAKNTGGLEKDYANDWSISVKEMFTLLIPNYMGGGGSLDYTGSNNEFYNLVRQNMANQVPSDQLDKAASQQMAALYWGEQPFVGVPIYFGAALIFLFILGLLLLKGELKTWLWITALFSLVVSMGDHTFVGSFLFDYFPFYNKFRAVSMALAIGQFAVAALGMLGLQEFLTSNADRSFLQKKMLLSLGITAGIGVLALLFAGQMKGRNDAQMTQVISAVMSAREGMMRTDLFRSLFFIAATSAILWFFGKGKLKPSLAAFLVLGLVVVDLVLVDKRSLNSSDFSMGVEAKAEIQMTQNDLQIKADSSGVFRVLDMSRGNPFTNSAASAFHQNVGGYHAAKLMLYQELIDSVFSKEFSAPVVNMLNVKYVLSQKGEKATNADRLGNAWFAKNIRVLNSAEEVLANIKTFDSRNEVLLQSTDAASLAGFVPVFDSANTIALTQYLPDQLTYTYSAKSDQLAVFSEIYYPEAKGWHLYLNGKPITGLLKANYLLRAAKLPAGQNQKLEMRFEPRSHALGSQLSLVGSIGTLLAAGAGLFFTFKNGGFGGGGNVLPDAPIVPKTPAKVPTRTPTPVAPSPRRTGTSPQRNKK